MKKILINFATNNFINKQRNNSVSGIQNGFDEVIDYKPEMFPAFYKEYAHILYEKKGAGYWLWKPMIILATLKAFANEGDLVFYSDSGATFISNVNALMSTCTEENPIILFDQPGLKLSTYTKRDTFYYMQADNESYYNTNILTASFQIYNKCQQSIMFVREYFNWCCDVRILTDIANTCGLPNLPNFIDHRHDQSILSIIAKQHDIKLHRDPSQFGNTVRSLYPSDKYNQIIFHHR